MTRADRITLAVTGLRKSAVAPWWIPRVAARLARRPAVSSGLGGVPASIPRITGSASRAFTPPRPLPPGVGLQPTPTPQPPQGGKFRKWFPLLEGKAWTAKPLPIGTAKGQGVSKVMEYSRLTRPFAQITPPVVRRLVPRNFGEMVTYPSIGLLVADRMGDRQRMKEIGDLAAARAIQQMQKQPFRGALGNIWGHYNPKGYAEMLRGAPKSDALADNYLAFSDPSSGEANYQQAIGRLGLGPLGHVVPAGVASYLGQRAYGGQ